MNIAVTGCSSNIGKGLLQKLIELDQIDKIIGIDVKVPDFTHSKFDFIKGDVRDTSLLTRSFDTCDVIIHLAFIVFVPVEDRNTAEDININGSINVFETARKLGITKIIYLSSVASYGNHPQDPTQNAIKESDELLGINADQFYLYTKGKVEHYLQKFRETYSEIVVTSIRPHIIIGPSFYNTVNLQNLAKDLKNNQITHIRQKNTEIPVVQYTDEHNLIDFIFKSLVENYNGAYNIAGDPTNIKSYADKHGIKFLSVPFWLAKVVTYLSYWFGRTSKVSLQWLPAIKYAIIVDNEKIKQILPDLNSTEQILDDLRNHV